MHKTVWLAVIAMSLWPASPKADEKSDCTAGRGNDLRITACSVLIERNPTDAIAYHQRGSAYQAKGDVDRAIADFSKAIELKPGYGPAYESRGRAYASRGDYTNAVADVTKGGELTPKPILGGKAITSSTKSTKVTTAKLKPKPKTSLATAKQSVVTKEPDNGWPDWAPSRY